ncbi:MAG: hypothetical protein H7Z16_01305 [Pyrinomonadaceae bacterium]|nr:hypothetical protein [Pyrinomonadaceae bacterium]
MKSPRVWEIPLWIVVRLVYCFLLYYLPAVVLTWILMAIFFPALPLKFEVVLVETPLFETMAQVATLFSLGANFADLACTYGRTRFWKHIVEYVIVIVPAYIVTLGLTWVGAQVLGLVIHYQPSPMVPAWRLYSIPALAPGQALNLVLLATLLFAYGAVCYRLRKRGGRSSGMWAIEYWGRNDYEQYLKALDAATKTNSTMASKPYEQIHQLVQNTRRRHALASDAEAFVWLFLERIVHLSNDAIKEAITQGSGDGGIDALHIDHKGAQVPDCDYQAVHIVACDYADSVAASSLPIARVRLQRLADTWVAIASNTDGDLKLNSALRRRITALHRYWQPIQNDVPHQVYLVTNRKRSEIDRVWIEQKMNYFMSNSYHYYEQADLIARLDVQRPD